MSRKVEIGESWLVFRREFECEGCGTKKRGYRVPGISADETEPCAPPLNWTVEDGPPTIFFCSQPCVVAYDARINKGA